MALEKVLVHCFLNFSVLTINAFSGTTWLSLNLEYISFCYNIDFYSNLEK